MTENNSSPSENSQDVIPEEIDNLSYDTSLFDKCSLLNKKFEVISQELLKIQQLHSQKEKGLEKYTRSLRIKDKKLSALQISQLEYFSNFICENNRMCMDENKSLISNLQQLGENLESLKKYNENNRKFLVRRIGKNEKMYELKKKMLSEIRDKQVKAAKEAQYFYIKHSKLLDLQQKDPNNWENVDKAYQAVEIKLIQGVNEEKRCSKQYENVAKQLENYRDDYVEEKKEVLRRYEELDLYIHEGLKKIMDDLVDKSIDYHKKQISNLCLLKEKITNFSSKETVNLFIRRNYNPYFKIEKAHLYDPYIPIYRRAPEEQSKLLKLAKEQEISIDVPAKSSKFFDKFLSKIKKNTDRGSKKEKDGEKDNNNNNNRKSGDNNNNNNRKSGEKGNNVSPVTKKEIRRRSSKHVMKLSSFQEKARKLEKPERTEEITFFEDFLKKLINEVPDSAKEEDLKKAFELLDTVEGRAGLSLAMNYTRSKPYIANFKVFKIVGELVRKCLIESYSKQDKDVGKMLLNMCHTFYTINESDQKQQFLLNHLSDMKIWKDLRFWECSFFDTMSDMRKKSVYYLSDSKWRDLDEQARKEADSEHANMTFGVLTSIIFSMMEANLEVDLVRKFIAKMCNINQLSQEQTQLIRSNFEEMIKGKK